MANHSVTVINQGGGSNQRTQNTSKPTSVSTQMRKSSNFNNSKSSKIANVSTKKSLAIAGIGVTAFIQSVKKGVNIYSNFMDAKTGEGMKYSNLKNQVGIIANPLGFAKKAIWDYGIIVPMKVARQNEALEYEKMLTGNLIYSKSSQRGIF